MRTFFRKQPIWRIIASLFALLFVAASIIVILKNTSWDILGKDSALHMPLEALSTNEWLWITENPDKLIVASRDTFPPFAYINHLGQRAGLLYDYLSIIEKKLGCQFLYVQYETPEALQNLLDTKQVAIVLDAEKGNTLRNLLETKVLFTSPRALYVNTTKKRSVPVYTLENIQGLRLAIEQNSASIHFLQQYYKKIILDISANPLETLSHLSRGIVDLAYMNEKTAEYYLREANFRNIASKGVAGPALQLLFGIRKDLPLLHNLMLRTLDSLSPEQHKRLIKKRLPSKGITMRLAQQIGIIFAVICSIFLIILGFFSLWTRSLQRQVVIKNAQLAEEMLLRCTIEKQLLQSAKAEAIGTLASGVHHDMNSIMAVISNYAEINTHSSDYTVLWKNSIKIHAVAQQAHAVLRKLQAYIRREPEQATYLPIHQSIEKSLVFLQGLLPKHVKMLHHSKINKVLIPDIDDTLLMQIIINLFSNASDAMDGRGTISITSYEHPYSRHGGLWILPQPVLPCVAVSIGDTGYGIAQSVLPHIFEAFFTTKTPERGTGMGLAIVHDILKRVHAGFHLETSTQGSVFTIYLPIKPPEAPTQDQQTSTPKMADTLQSQKMLLSTKPVIQHIAADTSTAAPTTAKSIALISADTDWLTKVQRIYQLCGCQSFIVQDAVTMPTLLQQANLVLIDSASTTEKIAEQTGQIRQIDPALPIVLLAPDTTKVPCNTLASYIAVVGEATPRSLAQILQYCR